MHMLRPGGPADRDPGFAQGALTVLLCPAYSFSQIGLQDNPGTVAAYSGRMPSAQIPQAHLSGLLECF